MAVLYERLKVLLVRVEAVPGTPETPDGTDAIRCLDGTIDLTAVEMDSVQTNYYRSTFGTSESRPTRLRRRIRFSTPLVGLATGGTPTPGNPAPMQSCLLGCRFAETINAGTSAEYKPDSAATSSVTIYLYEDGQLTPMSGAFGSVEVAHPINDVARLNFDFLGVPQPESTASAPSVDFSDWLTAKIVNKDTATYNLHGNVEAGRTYALNQNAQIVLHNNTEEDLISASQWGFAGNVEVKRVAFSTRNQMDPVKAGTKGPFTSTLDESPTLPGNIQTVSAPEMQLVGMAGAPADDIMYWNYTTQVNPVAGDDDITLTFL